MRFVLDASVTLSWLLRDASARDEPYAFAVLQSLRTDGMAASAPATWSLEIANVMARCATKSQITEAQAEAFLEILEALSIIVDPDTAAHALTDTLQLARRYRLSSYDASYLELALRNAAPLATLDEDLRRAARKAGVTHFKPA
ncbi:PilT protein domain protein [mine drainage metagenome]|uniref:PilT protein domain protein n=1 Tax=mine drainage metagenome TaxID=410659 RepID=T1A189_9ZZZZ